MEEQNNVKYINTYNAYQTHVLSDKLYFKTCILLDTINHTTCLASFTIYSEIITTQPVELEPQVLKTADTKLKSVH